jgi:hypothetical protein
VVLQKGLAKPLHPDEFSVIFGCVRHSVLLSRLSESNVGFSGQEINPSHCGKGQKLASEQGYRFHTRSGLLSPILKIKILDPEGKENGVNPVFLVGKQGILGGKGSLPVT